MTKLRFILNLVVVLLLIILSIIIVGLSIELYIDIASLILTILLPYIIISFVFPPKEQIKFMNEIFKPAGTGDRKELERAVIYFNSFNSLTSPTEPS